jgi:hypothetical protein
MRFFAPPQILHAWHREIKNHDVRIQLSHQVERDGAIFGLTANLPFRIRFDAGPDALNLAPRHWQFCWRQS